VFFFSFFLLENNKAIFFESTQCRSILMIAVYAHFSLMQKLP